MIPSLIISYYCLFGMEETDQGAKKVHETFGHIEVSNKRIIPREKRRHHQKQAALPKAPEDSPVSVRQSHYFLPVSLVQLQHHQEIFMRSLLDIDPSMSQFSVPPAMLLSNK